MFYICVIYSYIYTYICNNNVPWIQTFRFTLNFKQQKARHYEMSMNFRSRQPCDGTPVLPLASYVTLKSLIRFSET